MIKVIVGLQCRYVRIMYVVSEICKLVEEFGLLICNALLSVCLVQTECLWSWG